MNWVYILLKINKLTNENYINYYRFINISVKINRINYKKINKIKKN